MHEFVWVERSLIACGCAHVVTFVARMQRPSGADCRFHAKGFVAHVPLHAAAYITNYATRKESDSTLAPVPFTLSQPNPFPAGPPLPVLGQFSNKFLRRSVSF